MAETVKLLHLLRHAKSSWDDPAQADRDRPLAPRGRRAAGRLAGHLRDHGVRPAVVLCSPALRTRQTLEQIRPGLDEGVEVLIEDGLYGASASELLDRLHRLPADVTSVMVIGHNPGLQELTVLVAREGELRERARAHFPTAALATLAVRKGDWAGLARAGADLVSYLSPRDL
ncbi:MAG TPA: histidine phosphatase family protein [Candidatus Dormibacteraeota bacterium]|jgi:phosphohistidine phosphatase